MYVCMYEHMKIIFLRSSAYVLWLGYWRLSHRFAADSRFLQLIDMQLYVGTTFIIMYVYTVGVAFKKTFSYAGFEQQPKHLKEPPILLLNVELELK